MPRRPRGVITNTFLHVRARSTRGEVLFTHPRDYRVFVDWLREGAGVAGVAVHAYCLMTTHLHLLICVGEVTVSRFMHGLLQRYAQYFNRMYGSRGHVFGDRFWARPCEMDAYFLELLQYIHLNPVRAGLVARPEQYLWSSHRAYLRSDSGDNRWVETTALGLFGADADLAAKAYAAFIDLHLTVERTPPLTAGKSV